MTTQRWRELIKFLRNDFPLKKGVVIFRKPMKQYRGLTYYPEFNKIYIDSQAPMTYQAEALMHEWAHARAGTICHGLLWERQYGQIYRAWEKEFDPRSA